MRPLTRLEAHFLRTIRRAVLEQDRSKVEVCELYLLYPQKEPGLQLALRLPGSPLLFATVLIYGARPVRYQIEFPSDPIWRRARGLWDYCLGPACLVAEKSWVRPSGTQLFYEVNYPEAFLKKLGE